jgi:hypothetical protein
MLLCLCAAPCNPRLTLKRPCAAWVRCGGGGRWRPRTHVDRALGSRPAAAPEHQVTPPPSAPGRITKARNPRTSGALSTRSSHSLPASNGQRPAKQANSHGKRRVCCRQRQQGDDRDDCQDQAALRAPAGPTQRGTSHRSSNSICGRQERSLAHATTDLALMADMHARSARRGRRGQRLVGHACRPMPPTRTPAHARRGRPPRPPAGQPPGLLRHCPGPLRRRHPSGPHCHGAEGGRLPQDG